MKIFLKYLFIALSLFLSVQINAGTYSAKKIENLAKETAEIANAKNIAIPESTANNIEDLGGVPVVNKLANAGGKLPWSYFSKIKMKINSIDANGWLMGKYVNGQLKVLNNTKVAQKWDFIVKSNGEILVGRKHSWLSKGEDVLAAGELKFRNGKLVDISNASGHYLPSPDEASNFLRIFKNAGISVDDATLTILKQDGRIYKQIRPNSKNRLNYY